MQFKHPEILYFLALLIIPILVHLFQLQKFVKVPFTNVAFLQKLAQQTRKSSRIKKWLILAIRMLVLAAIIFAFSQPYFSNNKNIQNQHTFIYLDNSLSINTKGEKGNLLQTSIQEIIENAPEKDSYSLLTNLEFHENIKFPELKNILLNTKETSKNLDVATVLLKIETENKTKTNTLHKNILISDFQNTYNNQFTNVTPLFSAIKLKASQKNNISVDSVFISNANATNFTVNILVQNKGIPQINIPIAIYNQEKLISKQSFSIEENTNTTVQFTIQNQPTFLGKIEITFSDVFPFDNVFYFNLNNNKKINVLAIGDDVKYLSKIYTKEAFNFANTTQQNVNYNSILKQQIIVLNELENISEILTKSLLEFSKNGGNLVIIPNEKSQLNSYNNLLSSLKIGTVKPIIKDTLKITTIHYSHPLFQNVFSKKVSNFQYPNVQSYFPLTTKNNSKIVSFENGFPFIQQINTAGGKVYWLSSAIHKTNSNFLNSPLIVPVFYNFGKLSFTHPQLYYRVAKENKIDIETSVKKDVVLQISSPENAFIPLQETYQNKVTITTNEQPLTAGFYTILKENEPIDQLAFNAPKEESSLDFLDLEISKKDNKNIETASSIKSVFQKINKKNEVHWLWKWFLALAIVSLFLEIFILKFYKP
ncbi:BatA domain-containing protein [Polaribacter sp.]|uniref:BatA domain-containing protein n=1 Tax=Polaribacter sp. TaxID=1920175 RepID=UPI003EF50511